MTSGLKDTLVWLGNEWSNWFGGPPRKLYPVIISSGRHVPRLTLFVFQDRDTRPKVFVKIGLDVSDQPYVEREYRTVERLRGIMGEQHAVQIPEAFGFYSNPNFVAASYSVIEGKQLFAPRLVQRSSIIGRRLMARFWQETGSIGVLISQIKASGESRDQHWLAERVDRFRATYARTSREYATLRGFQAAVESQPLSVDLRWQHRDLAVGNVLVRRQDMTLVDWEGATDHCEPWFDLSTAPTAAVILGARQAGLTVEKAALTILPESHWTGRMMKKAITERWIYDVPIGWGIVLSAMQRALSRPEAAGNRALPYAQIVLALIGDAELRRRASWAVPTW